MLDFIVEHFFADIFDKKRATVRLNASLGLILAFGMRVAFAP